MAKLERIIHINKADFSALVSDGYITIDGVTYYYDNTGATEYIIDDPDPPAYADTAGYATTAGTANYATSDADGNSIVDTYSRYDESLTYSALVSKISNDDLKPGQRYRITDYITTVNTNTAYTANNAWQFDLIVTATGLNTLDHRASAINHSGVTYYSTCDLSKWQIWYDVNNDTNKYGWANASTGKGVIYRMIDEWNNDCPYDFKNIQFNRPLTDGEYDPDNGTDAWVYTFNGFVNGGCVDLSLNVANCIYDNTIKPFGLSDIDMLGLNDNVFLGTGCYANTLEDDCFSNTFGSDCSYNTLGKYCYNNVFGNSCNNNVFGNYCNNVTSGHNCINNVIGQDCNTITFGESCCNNSIGNGCLEIYFEDSNGDYGDFVRNVVIENGCQYIKLYKSGTADDTHYLQNIYIAQGLIGDSLTYIEISTIDRALEYRTTVARVSGGTLRIYNEDDIDTLSGLSDTNIVSPANNQVLIYDSATSKWVNGTINTSLAENITYSSLVALKTANGGAGSLVPGMMYRITDYATTTALQDTQSAGHAFDLIVMATSPNTLDCRALAALHSGDTYFSASGNTCDLSKWQIRYDINNDIAKYAWADTSTGKGVIYRMIDDLGNDCPYDFKNIQFKRKLTSGEYDPASGTDTWVYTFSKYSSGNIIDPTLIKTNGVYDNIMGEYWDAGRLNLNNNVFIGGTSSYYNEIGMDCFNNTFGDECQYNKLGKGCNANTIGNECSNNIFGDYCFVNTIGDDCQINRLGSFCQYNTLVTNCISNIIGDYSFFIQLGDGCYTNVFEIMCYYITLGEYCMDNTFGAGCNNISFGDSNGDYGDYVRNTIVGNGCQYIRLYNSGAANISHYLQNIYIAQGLIGDSLTYIEISTIDRALEYRTTVGKETGGTLRIYNEDDVSGASVTLRDWTLT